MPLRPGPGRISEAEYLAFEDSQPTKHELVNGEIVAMSGASAAHNRLEVNLMGLLIAGLRGGPCRVNTSNFRVKIDETGMYAYPRSSVRTLLFVDSRSRWVHRQDRNADGSWRLTDVYEGEVELLGVRLALDDIYADVDFEA